MTTYNTPEEPAGPVWDKDGDRWERMRSGTWLRDGATWSTCEWHRLLHLYGPLTDTPPVKVGDKITLNEFSKMPNWSIGGGFMSVYINNRGHVFTDRQEEEIDLSGFGYSQVIVLRVGEGEE